MALNLLGGEAKQTSAPVTLPKVFLPPEDVAEEAAEAAARIAERRIIRLGLDAWKLTEKSASFENWTAIGRALKVGRDVAVRASGVETGKHYARAFYSWADRHGFTGMDKSARWAAVDLVENLDAIQAWRATLPEKQRRRLVNPLSNCRRWRRSLAPKLEADALAKATVALRHFIVCMEALTPAQAAPLWQAVNTQAQRSLT